MVDNLVVPKVNWNGPSRAVWFWYSKGAQQICDENDKLVMLLAYSKLGELFETPKVVIVVEIFVQSDK